MAKKLKPGKAPKRESWKLLEIEGVKNYSKYEISNMGNIKSYAEDHKNGRVIKGSRIGGYKTLCVRLENGKRSTRYFHKLVAQHFLKNKDNRQYVVHVNHDKLNNGIDNLAWADKEQVTEHQKTKPIKRKKPGRKKKKA